MKTHHVVKFRAWDGIQGKTLQGQDVGGCGLEPSGEFIGPLGGRKEEIETIKVLVGNGFGGKQVRLLNVAALGLSHGYQSKA